MTKRVCVVGAGAAGLTTTKWCLQEGLDVICYDKRALVGGLWSLEDEVSRADLNNPADIQCRPFATCQTNDNKEAFAFSDFRLPKDCPINLVPRRVGQYLEDYTDHFNLRPHIKLNTRVVNIKRKHNDHGWLVTTKPIGESHEKVRTDEVDAVVICSGSFNRQYRPSVKGIESFKGEISHAGDFYRPDKFRSKNVLVIGGSTYASEIACDISREAEQTYLSARHGLWPMQRMIGGMPYQYTPIWSRYTNLRYNVSQFDQLFGPFLRRRFNFRDYSMEPTRGLCRMQVATCDDIEFRIAAGALTMKGEIKEMTKNRVTFKDGSSIDGIDSIVFATGFKLSLDFLEEDPSLGPFEPSTSYKYVIPVEDESRSLCFVGLVYMMGPNLVCIELQARLAARVIAGKLMLPSKEEMERSIEKDRMENKETFGEMETYKQLIWVPPYMESIAELIGARPTPWRIFLLFFMDPKLAHQLLFMFPYAPTYRLYGAHSDWEQSRKFIMEIDENLLIPLRTVKYPETPQRGCNKIRVLIGCAILCLIGAWLYSRWITWGRLP
ncbi:unnamed protein product [Owenia fusiformis]|uniref:Flavin-containing monooxygenase n=1 Tax=Owenia fusiformis TaxID=6347 RepID=A0A8J1Y9N4_OWEFU|nr:unnamed protein product [Owenia fusiformis]